jgi:hypothetical protein
MAEAPATTTSATPSPSTTTIAVGPGDNLGHGDASGQGNDNGPLIDEPTATTTPSTTAQVTTTVALGVPEAPQTLRMTCSAQPAPVSVRCTWNLLNPGESPRLLRGVRGSAVTQSKVAIPASDSRTFEDLTVDIGMTYTYQLQSVRSDGSVSTVSPLTTVACCET